MHTLQNNHLTLTIASHGAEWQSLKDQQQRERLWQGDSTWWGRRAPVLFPIVGRLKEDQYQHQGQSYRMTQHGFARDREFHVIAHSDTHITHRLNTTEPNYPFAYQLDITTHLEGKHIHTEYCITNPSNTDTLLCAIGAHPAFNLTPHQHYRIQIEAENLTRFYLKPPYFDRHKTDSNPSREFAIDSAFHADLCQHDTLVYHSGDPRYSVALMADNGERLQITTTLPYFGIWQPLKGEHSAPFICLEPWNGVADFNDTTGKLAEKTGIIAIAPHSKHHSHWTLTLD